MAETTQVAEDAPPGENIGNAGVTGAERDALIKVVEETRSGAKPETKIDEQEITDGAPLKPEPKKEPEEEQPSKLHQELRAREKAKGILAKAQEREAASHAAYAEAQKIVEQAKQFAAQVNAEYQKLMRLRTDPVAVINEMGWDPNTIIEAGAKQKDPEWQARMAAQRASDEARAKLEQDNRALAERLERLEKDNEGYKTQTSQVARVTAEKKMISLIPENSPAHQLVAAGIWSEKHLLELAYDADRQVRQKAKRVPSLDELAGYIHFEATEKLRRLKPQESAGRSNAGKSKANGSRALSSRDASERRGAAPPKDFNDMTPDEQRAHLLAVVEEARKTG